MNKSIGVMGCGWFGLPLAKTLIKDTYTVHGTTTSEEKLSSLKNEGVIPFLISLSEETIVGDISGFLEDIDVLIINIPPKLRGGASENYVKKIQLLHKEILQSKVRKVIFVSSTSVYGAIDGEVTEASPPKPTTASGEQLLEAENILKNDTELKTTIIRFGGLIGPNRHPINMLSGRKKLSNGNAPVNLIHLADCIRITSAIIANSWWNEIINGVYPKHPSKREYYTKAAQKEGIQVPDYKEDDSKKGKVVRANTLLNVKKFKFKTTP